MKNCTLGIIVWLSFIQYANSQIAKQYDVVIDEIFADPTPEVGLPALEFVELKNISVTPLNLSGWELHDGNSTAILPDFILQPDSFIIVCGKSAAVPYASFGTTLGVSSFPSLDNDGDIIYLRSPENIIIHAVSYSTSWYQNELKRLEGGRWK